MNKLLEITSILVDCYSKIVEPVCEKYSITKAEFDIVMFLANNPCFDTATDVVVKRHIAKSYVSMSVKSLEKKGYIERFYLNNNRRTIHLRLKNSADNIIKDGRAAQKSFYELMFKGIADEDMDKLGSIVERMQLNMEKFKEEV